MKRKVAETVEKMDYCSQIVIMVVFRYVDAAFGIPEVALFAPFFQLQTRF
jgi:hypothetical protein